MINSIETTIWKEVHDVNHRLPDLGLESGKLLNVVRAVMSSGAEATPYHAVTAEGTFRYHEGVFRLRKELIGPDSEWEICRNEGIEGVRHKNLGIKITISNVDTACNDQTCPKPRSKKGSGAERVCSKNLSFFSIDGFAPKEDEKDEKSITYYLMIDEKGASELSIPIVSGGTFIDCVERIYLSDGKEFDPTPLQHDDTDFIEDFDPQIERK